MSTGWFGVPGKVPSKSTKVHAFHKGRTLCGWKPGFRYQFQWCAHWIVLSMIDCSKCQVSAQKILDKIAG